MQHRHDDVRTLALRRAEEGVDVKWCLQQIEGWQKACEKLPRWSQVDGLWYPPALSMEQCSSELTARYKATIVSRLLPECSERGCFADLTGGYGIDFSYIASLFATSVYVERNAELCRIAEHNFYLLKLVGPSVVCADSTEFLYQRIAPCNLIYLDPARRDDVGRKTVAIADCTPDVVQLQDRLMQVGRYVMVKLSPMLDISAALSVLRHVGEVHVVSVDGECKEVLLVLCRKEKESVHYFTTNIAARTQTFCTETRETEPAIASLPEQYLYEPNASILKAGIQDALCEAYDVRKLHPFSHLFVSSHFIEDFHHFDSIIILQIPKFSRIRLKY